MRFPRLLTAATAAACLAGCIHVRMDPIEVHAKIDMEVRLKADQVVEESLSEINRLRLELQKAESKEAAPTEKKS